MKHLLSILIAMSMSVLPALAAKTAVPTLQRVNTKAPMSVGAAVAGAQAAAATEQPASPLDEPFSVKHAYPGTNVATDLVALEIRSLNHGKGVCTGTRFHKRWIITAAHCFDKRFDTKINPRIVFGAKQLANGVWQVSISEPQPGAPTNGTLYFYRNGYSQFDAYAHADDIAIIGVDKEDKVMALINKNLKELDVATAQMQNVSAMMAKNKAPSLAQAEQATSVQAAARKKLANTINDQKRFLQLPLNAYHFMTFSPESARLELAGRKANGYWFEPVVNEATEEVLNRKLPVKYPFIYQGVPKNQSVVQWQGEEPGGMSGTPFIINGYIVTVGSGEGKNPLLTDEFTAFLKRSMGADYKQGLCVRSVANEESITQRTQP
ncbi:MAG: trypsin-like serine protease [Elusimicrobiaceae bacterium]|nr:trypsin-like serine protease [Elusimicrobiaceae bacterium]